MNLPSFRLRLLRAAMISLLVPGAMAAGLATADEIPAGSRADDPAAGNPEQVVDTDGDGLGDEWEGKWFGDLSHGPDEDADSDSLGNLLESEIGTNPRLRDSDGDGREDWIGIPGHLYQEIWPERAAPHPRDYYPRHAFDAVGATVFFHPGAEVRRKSEPDFRQRLRGRIVAPATGDYEFWISSNNWCELWLGEDESRFSARRLAGLPDGRLATRPREFDRYPAQKSAPVSLVAGREYYVEILHRHRKNVDHHVIVAWKPPGGERTIIPPEVLRSWVPEAGDAADDGIPDTWKTARELPGGRRIALDDPDGDGVVNALEYRAGSDPHDGAPVPGLLAWSRWYDPPGSNGSHFDLGRFRTSQAGDREPDALGAAPAAGLRLPVIGTSLLPTIDRLRGTIRVPESGLYSFWIMGRTSAELSISPDDRPAGLRPIANRSRNHSVSPPSNGLSTERSIPVWLEKGEPRFIEMLHGPGERLHLAWRRHDPRQWSQTTLGGGVGGDWSGSGLPTMLARVHGPATFGGAAGDGLAFRHSTVAAQCEAICRLDSLHSLPADAGGGLMLRASDDPFAPFVGLTVDGDRRFGLHHRLETAGTEQSLSSRPYPDTRFRLDESVWLRLLCDGKTCTAYYSSDAPGGIKWKTIGSAKIAFGETILAGPVAWGGRGEQAAEVAFSHLALGSPLPDEEVPAEIFATPGIDPLDRDADDLPDAWERASGLDPAAARDDHGPRGDPDRDGFPNLEEFRLGGHPLEPGGFPGFLTLELWNGIPGSSVADLTGSRKYLGEPDLRELVARPDLQGGDGGVNYGQRLRGTLVAPVSGTYQFWLAGDNGASLSLSADAGKSRLREIAALAGTGGESTALHEWNKFAGQASREIELVAGEEYFLEILHKEGRGADHVSVAWQYRSADGTTRPREILPSHVLKSYVPDLGDVDDDRLPDEWESRYGLDPADNGFRDPLRQGARGDFDDDGLTNLEEYLLGTRPDLPDTDGDGVGDLDEVRIYRSNPNLIDALPPVLDQSATLAKWIGRSGTWLVGADGTLQSMARRGALHWDLEVSTAGIYLIEVLATARGTGVHVPPVPVTVSVDGIETLRGQFNPGDRPTRLTALTRWLSAGTHRVTLENRNVRVGVGIAISAVKLYRHEGDDEGGNGIPDWMEEMLRSRSGVTREQTEATVSPACIEGQARFLQDVSLVVGETAIIPKAGLQGEWFAGVALEPAAPVVLNATFEGGAITTTHTIRWVATNLLACPEVQRLRVGDSLLLTAHPENVDPGAVSFKITDGAGFSCSGAADRPLQVRFDGAGRTVLTATVPGVPQRSVNVVVSAADFGEVFSIAAGYPRLWQLPRIPRDLFIECDRWLTLTEQPTEPPADRAFMAEVTDNIPARVLARLWNGGPVVAATSVNGFRLASATVTGQSNLIRVLADGTRVVQVGYAIDGPVPADLSIWLRLYVTDAVFANGDTWCHLTADDFDENGLARITILKAPGGDLAFVCHWIMPYGDKSDPPEAPESERADGDAPGAPPSASPVLVPASDGNQSSPAQER